MELENLLKGLNTATKRRIVQLLAKKDMSAPELYERLNGLAPKYRQSVNKPLDQLDSAGIVEKYYDKEKKALIYHLVKDHYTIDLVSLIVT